MPSGRPTTGPRLNGRRRRASGRPPRRGIAPRDRRAGARAPDGPPARDDDRVEEEDRSARPGEYDSSSARWAPRAGVPHMDTIAAIARSPARRASGARAGPAPARENRAGAIRESRASSRSLGLLILGRRPSNTCSTASRTTTRLNPHTARLRCAHRKPPTKPYLGVVETIKRRDQLAERTTEPEQVLETAEHPRGRGLGRGCCREW